MYDLIVALHLIGPGQQFSQSHPLSGTGDHVAKLVLGGGTEDVVVFHVLAVELAGGKSVQLGQRFPGMPFIEIQSARKKQVLFVVLRIQFRRANRVGNVRRRGVVPRSQRGIGGFQPVMIRRAGGHRQLFITLNRRRVITGSHE